MYTKSIARIERVWQLYQILTSCHHLVKYAIQYSLVHTVTHHSGLTLAVTLCNRMGTCITSVVIPLSLCTLAVLFPMAFSFSSHRILPSLHPMYSILSTFFTSYVFITSHVPYFINIVSIPCP
jgi:hypothetical protein